MIAARLALVAAMSGAWDGGSASQTSTPADAPRPSAGLVSVNAEQVPSSSKVMLRVTILNPSADRSVWINARPRVSTRSFHVRDSEVELTIMDVHRRMVTDLCESLPATPDRGRFVTLKPKQTIVVDVDLDTRCFSLAPREKLLLQLTYGATKDWPKPDSAVQVPLEPVGLKDWKKIVVPDGWKDTATPPPF